MMAEFKPISLLPMDGGETESPGFREVIAYLKGVADTVAAQNDCQGPVSLSPSSLPPTALRSSLRPISVRPVSLAPDWKPSERAGNRITLRFGELPVDCASVRPHAAAVALWEPTRGGARMIDPGSVPPVTAGALGVTWRRTLPYGAPTVSLAATPPSLPPWAEHERPSGVRLRTAELPREWYELSGTA